MAKLGALLCYTRLFCSFVTKFNRVEFIPHDSSCSFRLVAWLPVTVVRCCYGNSPYNCMDFLPLPPFIVTNEVDLFLLLC